MRRGFLFFIILSIISCAPCLAYDWSTNPGDGSPDNPYQISTPEQLISIGSNADLLDKHFVLVNDIIFDPNNNPEHVFDKAVIAPDEDDTNDSEYDVTAFTGFFDGSDHKILNLTIMDDDDSCIGLFGLISNGEVKNTGLENIDIHGYSLVGGLCGWNNHGTISNCYATGSVSGDSIVGGLCGGNPDGTISSCYANGSVTGTEFVGGLCGGNNGNAGTISECYAIGEVSGVDWVGGLCGVNLDGTISNCYATGDISGYYYVGGLCGYNVGWAGKGTIDNCYATVEVSGVDWIGGLTAYNYDGTISNSFWDTETSGLSSSDGGTGLPTAQMQTLSTFIGAGWDFVGEFTNGIEDIWYIPQQDYPHLWWEGKNISMNLTPPILNCRSQGNKVKAHLTLPEQFSVEDIDPARPAVVHTYGIESAPVEVFVNEEENVEITAPFDREQVCSLMSDWPEMFRVYGFFTDGSIFFGESGVRINPAGLKEIAELAMYWLAECGNPDWCEGLDLNRDTMVNLQDYPLLLNSEVEFLEE